MYIRSTLPEDHHGEEIIRIVSARAAEKHENPKISGTGSGLIRERQTLRRVAWAPGGAR